jgi:hypothetical protein
MRTPPHVILLLGAAMLWIGHARAAGPLIRPANPQAKLAYEQARELAAANYKNARVQCDAVTGNPKDLCVAEAKAARVRTEEEARAKYEDTLKAYTRARLRIADADYDRDKTRCAGLAGNDKDVCAAQAKAALVAARADAGPTRKPSKRATKRATTSWTQPGRLPWNAAMPLPAPPATSASPTPKSSSENDLTDL